MDACHTNIFVRGVALDHSCHFFAENLKDNNVGLAALIASNYVHLIKVTECWKLHLSSKNFRVERRKIWFVMLFALETSIR